MSIKNFEKILNSDLEINNTIVSLFAEGAYIIFLQTRLLLKFVLFLGNRLMFFLIMKLSIILILIL